MTGRSWSAIYEIMSMNGWIPEVTDASAHIDPSSFTTDVMMNIDLVDNQMTMSDIVNGCT